MPIRNPVYLDTELVRNVADYLGVPTIDVSFQEKDSSSRGGRAGINVHAVNIGGQAEGANETQRTYEVRVTPVRLMNDTIDAALSETMVRSATDAVSRRDLIEIDGVLELTLASEFGAILGLILPSWTPGTEIDSNVIMQGLLGAGEKPAFDQLYELTETGRDESVYVAVTPGAFFGDRGPDDLSTEVTVFATVDRLVPDGGELPLDAWLFPGANRLVRRALASGQDLDDVVNKLGPALGKPAEADFRVQGPAIVLRPIAIY